MNILVVVYMYNMQSYLSLHTYMYIQNHRLMLGNVEKRRECLKQHSKAKGWELPIAYARRKYMHVWQSHVEIEGYSIAYFNHIVVFEGVAELPLRAGLIRAS